MDLGFIEITGIILLIGILGFYFLKVQASAKNNQQKVDVFADRKKEALPIKLQAYERMLLFCERINPVKMLVRVKPNSTSVDEYLFLILQNIEQEFEHNLVQQLYISDACWNVIITSKTSIINRLKQVALSSENSQDFREKVMLSYQNNASATEAPIAFIKSEIKKYI
ncbi:MAG: hypothetical protein P8H13_09115 [Polaribacter sp.]|nr:hypothetical protein [Polaribacter sp.]MDG1812081.1 hypothetical protein [Polaribacter sp.]MDG1992906.1 hypothetical protein [Polaribacter sp.]